MKWKEKTTAQRAVTLLLCLVSVVVFVCALLQIFGICGEVLSVTIPLLGVVNLCQAYLHWNVSRDTAHICLGAAVFIFGCALAVFLL